MSSTSPATAFAAVACATIASAATLAVLWLDHRARTGFQRIACFEENCPSGGRCEMGFSFCPSCGTGPLPPEQFAPYPARLNHREALTCLSCALNARAKW